MQQWNTQRMAENTAVKESNNNLLNQMWQEEQTKFCPNENYGNTRCIMSQFRYPLEKREEVSPTMERHSSRIIVTGENTKINFPGLPKGT